jgi:hypothetical protein
VRPQEQHPRGRNGLRRPAGRCPQAQSRASARAGKRKTPVDSVPLPTGTATATQPKPWGTLHPSSVATLTGIPTVAVGPSEAVVLTGLEIRDVVMWLHAQGVPKSRRLPGGFAAALKPTYEPILLARAPLSGTLAQNHATHGTGGLGIEATRRRPGNPGERWPANLLLSHDDRCREERCRASCAVKALDAGRPQVRPSRFFYTAKASKSEREAGCDELPAVEREIFSTRHGSPRRVRNSHPTIKPLAVMRWLIALTCPVGGIVLDPFTGSGTTGAAALLEGRAFVGIEQDPNYVQIACARITHWGNHSA